MAPGGWCAGAGVSASRPLTDGCDVRLRLGRADDVAKLAQLHGRVFDGSMGAAMGPRYLAAFFSWFLTGAGATLLVAECDGRVAGYALGAPHGHGGAVTRELLPVIVSSVLTRPAVWTHANFRAQLRGRIRTLLGRPPVDEPDEYGAETYNLVAIGTAPEFRRRGISSELLDQLEAFGRSRGFDRIVLHVYADNDAARSLYTGRGYGVAVDAGRVLTLEKPLCA